VKMTRSFHSHLSRQSTRPSHDMSVCPSHSSSQGYEAAPVLSTAHRLSFRLRPCFTVTRNPNSKYHQAGQALWCSRRHCTAVRAYLIVTDPCRDDSVHCGGHLYMALLINHHNYMPLVVTVACPIVYRYYYTSSLACSSSTRSRAY
jgi:hypothetical protein